MIIREINTTTLQSITLIIMSKIPSEYLDEKAYLSFMKSAIKINKGEVKITSIMGIN